MICTRTISTAPSKLKRTTIDMPILVDYNHLYLASVFRSIEQGLNDEVSFRQFFLSSLLYNKKKFKHEFGEIVICADNPRTWRKTVFPYYKGKRQEARAADTTTDWKMIFECMHNMLEDLRENFPYKVMKIDLCEADDIIGVICHKYGKFLNNDDEKILILSRDKDFKQLQFYSNVQQYAPTKKEYIVESNPEEFLQILILKGDKDDGVPNVLSADDSIVMGVRATVFSKKRLEHYKKPENREAEPIVQQRYKRNKMLVDLTSTPQELVDKILNEYETQEVAPRKKLQSYFMEKRLKLLAQDIGDF